MTRARHARLRRKAATGLLLRLERWIEGLPDWARPAVYGALSPLLLAGTRMILVMAVALAVMLATRARPLDDLVTLLECLGIVVAGGAASGVAYSLVGRSLARIPRAGPYIGGVGIILPYVTAIMVVVRMTDTGPLFAHPLAAQFVIGAFCALLFGPMMGEVFLMEDGDAPTK